MTNFILLEYTFFSEGATYKESSFITGEIWVNLDKVVSYHSPSHNLTHDNGDSISLSDKGDRDIVEYLKNGQSDA